MKLAIIGKTWNTNERDNQEQERGICIVCPWHADTIHQLARTLIAMEPMPMIAYQQRIDENTTNGKLMIPNITIEKSTAIQQAIQDLGIANDLIQILDIENKEIDDFVCSMSRKSYIDRMMKELEIEDKAIKQVETLTASIRDIDYNFSSLFTQEEPRAYNDKYAKKFHQKSQWKTNNKGFSKSNYNRKK